MSLKQEIEKMLTKIEPLVDKIEVRDEKGERMLSNMKAYIDDSKHFLENGDLVKSFEAIVFAYGILETCIDLGVFVVRNNP